MLESEFQREHAFESATEQESTCPISDNLHESVDADDVSVQMLDNLTLNTNPAESCESEEIQIKALPASSSGQDLVASDENSEDVALGDTFFEEIPPSEISPHELLELQKDEKMRELRSEKNLGKLDGIWKKVTAHQQDSRIRNFQNAITSRRCSMHLLRICLLLNFSFCHTRYNDQVK